MKTSDAKIVEQALAILARDLRKAGVKLSSPDTVKNFLTLHLAQEEREVFGVLWMDVTNRVIAQEDMFFGTLTHTAVYPREVVKTGLKHNAAGMICYHNHPSGRPEPSEADTILTRALQVALALVDIRTLDHIIVGGMETYSFAENDLI